MKTIPNPEAIKHRSEKGTLKIYDGFVDTKQSRDLGPQSC